MSSLASFTLLTAECRTTHTRFIRTRIVIDVDENDKINLIMVIQKKTLSQTNICACRRIQESHDLEHGDLKEIWGALDV
jgi:hypothetical protein